MELLERERAWKETEFDFVLQFLRTVLLKHGASLIYTIPSVPSPLSPLLLSLLSIPSPNPQAVKYNVIDRDKIVIPPGWDSWGKIIVLREGFDAEGISMGWGVDVATHHALDEDVDGAAVEIYEGVIEDPSRDDGMVGGVLNGGKGGLEVGEVDVQGFYAMQLEILERRDGEEGISGGRGYGRRPQRGNVDGDESGGRETPVSRGGQEHGRTASQAGGTVREQLGPVQFNVGGIQMDADDMVRNVKVLPTTSTLSTTN